MLTQAEEQPQFKLTQSNRYETQSHIQSGLKPSLPFHHLSTPAPPYPPLGLGLQPNTWITLSYPYNSPNGEPPCEEDMDGAEQDQESDKEQEMEESDPGEESDNSHLAHQQEKHRVRLFS